MAKIFTGRDGSLLLSGTTAAKVVNIRMQGDLETLETTTVGDNNRTYIPGIQSFSGTATLMYYKQDDNKNDAGTLLRRILRTSPVETSDVVSMTVRLNDGNTTHNVSFNAYITSANFGISVGEIINADISFQVTGPLTTVTI